MNQIRRNRTRNAVQVTKVNVRIPLGQDPASAYELFGFFLRQDRTTKRLIKDITKAFRPKGARPEPAHIRIVGNEAGFVCIFRLIYEKLVRGRPSATTVFVQLDAEEDGCFVL